MKRGNHTKDNLTAFGKRYLEQMALLRNKPYVKNGILQAKFSVPKQDEKKPKGVVRQLVRALILAGSGGPTLGEVAVWNEFGTADGHVPERSFIRSTWDANANNKATWAGYAEELRDAINQGKLDVRKALMLMGLRIKKDVQEKIRSDIPPKNAPSTLAAKFPKTKTLINTGQLLNGQDLEVHDRHEL